MQFPLDFVFVTSIITQLYNAGSLIHENKSKCIISVSYRIYIQGGQSGICKFLGGAIRDI